MKIQALTFKGHGTSIQPISLVFPNTNVVVITGRTGGNKSAAVDALKRVFGIQTPIQRIISPDRNGSSFVEVAFSENGKKYELMIQDNGWMINGKTVGSETFPEAFRKIFHPAVSMKDFFITEQSALRNLAAFDHFVRSTSEAYASLLKYTGLLESLLSVYKRERATKEAALKDEMEPIELQSLFKDSRTKIDVLTAELQELETRQKELHHIEEHYGLVLGKLHDFSKKIAVRKAQVTTLEKLAEKKESNIHECEVKLKNYPDIDDVRVCARKTEVSMEVKLKEMEADLVRISTERGKIISDLKATRTEAKEITKEITSIEKMLQKMQITASSLGIDIAEGVIFKENEIRSKIRIMQSQITDAVKDHETFYEELGIMQKTGDFLGRFSGDHCPCCGTVFKTPQELLEMVNDRIANYKKALKTITTLKGKHQQEIKKLRQLADSVRTTSLKNERIKVLKVRLDELNQKIDLLEQENERNNHERGLVNDRRNEITKTLQLEQRLIDAEKLQEKMSTAKIELKELREKIKDQRNEIETIEKMMKEMDLPPDIKKTRESVLDELVSTNSQILNKKAEITDLEEQIKQVRAREKKYTKMKAHAKIAVEKHRVCREYLDVLMKEIGIYEMAVDEKYKIGKVTDILNIVDLDKETGKILRDIGGKEYPQDLIALSTGERVLVATHIKAINGIWNRGGFAIIDADLSVDVMFACVDVLREHGCDQIIFLKVTDGDLAVTELR